MLTENFHFAAVRLHDDAKIQEQIDFLSSRNSNILNPNWTSAYSEIKNDLKTGDVILVHGKYPFSWVVELLQWSKWGHSAIVIKAKDIDPSNIYNFPEIMLWESNTGDQEVPNLWGDDTQRNKVKEGPMLISLEERLKRTQSSYEDVEIVHRRLNAAVNFDAAAIKQHFDDYIAKKFPTDIEVIHSVYLGRKYNRWEKYPSNNLKVIHIGENIIPVYVNVDNIESLPIVDDSTKEKIYCSELVAAFFRDMGLLTNQHVSNAYSPKDFSAEGTVVLLKRSWLDAEMYINMFK